MLFPFLTSLRIHKRTFLGHFKGGLQKVSLDFSCTFLVWKYTKEHQGTCCNLWSVLIFSDTPFLLFFPFFFLFFTWIASALRVASCPKRNFNHFLNILFNKYLGKACKCIESSLDSSSSFFYRTNYLYSELIHSIRLSRDVGSIVGGSANSLCLVEKWKNTLHKRRRIWFTRTQISFFFFFLLSNSDT